MKGPILIVRCVTKSVRVTEPPCWMRWGCLSNRDSVTFPKLGNTGSVALPLTLAAAALAGEIKTGDRTALLGIGSGINSVMLATTWGSTAVRGNLEQLLMDDGDSRVLTALITVRLVESDFTTNSLPYCSRWLAAAPTRRVPSADRLPRIDSIPPSTCHVSNPVSATNSPLQCWQATVRPNREVRI